MAAIAAIAAMVFALWDAAWITTPMRLLSATAQAGTTGSGSAEVDSRFAPWRITPEEAQRRFATRSTALFPPTRLPPTPENWSPPYASVAKKQAQKELRSERHGEVRAHASAHDLRRARSLPSPGAPPAVADSAPSFARPSLDAQMAGR